MAPDCPCRTRSSPRVPTSSSPCRRSSGRRSRSAARGGGVARTPDELRAAIAHGLAASPVGQVLVEEYLAGWQEHELEVMCDAARQRDRRLLDREPRPDGRPHRRLVDRRAAADARRPRVPAAPRGRVRDCARPSASRRAAPTCSSRSSPETRAVPRDRDEPARLALVRARVEGDRLPDREARGAARGRVHARRAAERHHRQDDGRVRAGARLRRGQGAALRLREVPGRRARGSAPRCAPSASRSASGARSPRRS